MSDCVFSGIVAGQAPAGIVHEDDVVLVSLDIRPVTPGHVLVIPKRHEATGARLFRAGMRLAAASRRSGPRCDGVNLFLADGAAAGQEVFHVHLHVFPRFAGDAVRIDADWSAAPPRAEHDAIAARIRSAGRACGR